MAYKHRISAYAVLILVVTWRNMAEHSMNTREHVAQIRHTPVLDSFNTQKWPDVGEHNRAKVMPHQREENAARS